MHSSTDPILNIASGVSVIGGAGGVGALFDGPINVLNNSGSLSTADGVTGLALQGRSGDMTANNSGTLFGNIQLAAGGTNVVNNLSGGTILAGPLLDLGGGTLNNAGVLQSGSSTTGATTINGSLMQSSTGSMIVRLDQAARTADSFNVTGSVVLNGLLRPAVINGSHVAPGSFTLNNFMTASGGLNISGLSIAQSAIMNYSLSNAGGSLSFTSTADFSPNGLSTDGKKIAALIGNAQGTSLPHFGLLTASLVNIPSVAALNQAYWNVSGASTSSISNVGSQMTTSFMTLMLNPFGGAPASNPAAMGFARDFGAAEQKLSSQAATAYAAVTPKGSLAMPTFDQRWSIWSQAYGGSNKTTSDTSVAGADLNARTYGLATGFDYRVSPDTMVGLALAGGGSSFNMANGTSGRSDAFQAGVYGSKRLGEAYISAALAYTAHDVSTSRTLSLVNATYTAGFKAQSFGGRVETGYRVATPLVGITPYAAFQVQSFITPSYSEAAVTGSPQALALGYDRRASTATRAEFGAMFDKLFALKNGNALAIRTRAAWAHDHSDNPNVNALFQTVPGGNFSVSGTAPVPNLALLSAGAELRLPNRVTLGAKFDGEFAGRSQTYTGTGMVRYEW